MHFAGDVENILQIPAVVFEVGFSVISLNNGKMVSSVLWSYTNVC